MTRPAFLEPFNAKAMTYQQVANTFVTSERFSALAGCWNAILVGPRGSGKTTLLKMLSLEGQLAWSGPVADSYRDGISYTGIYVPSDIAWGEMVKSLTCGDLDPRCSILLSEAAFVTSVLLATATAMERRLALGADDSGNRHAAAIPPTSAEPFIASLSRLWKLRPESVSLGAIVEALRIRLLDIKQQAHLLEHTGSSGLARAYESMPYLGLPMLEAVTQALAAFDEATGRRDDQWALLLDELEVAPAHLQRVVLTGLRAVGLQKVILKVALAPCGPQAIFDEGESNVATPLNDVRQIELWYADKRDASEFCEQVFKSRVRHYDWLKDKSATEVFGVSAYAIVDETGELSSSPTSTQDKRKQSTRDFASLVDKDSTFAHFITHKKIDLQQLDASPGALNGNTIRKIAPLVAFRNAYRGRTEGLKRGVKPFNAAYCGWEAISAISEGNPRWLIGMINAMVGKSDGTKLPISVPAQTGHARSTSQAYADMLQTVANEQFDTIRTSTPMFDRLRAIGEYFHTRLVMDDFVEDPPMSFTVDEDVSGDVENALRIALNHGAIVCYESVDGIGGFRSLRGKRFRLTYLLAPIFKLPIRKSKAVGLSSILQPKRPQPPEQGDLWA